MVCDSVEAVVAKEIDKAVQPLLNYIADLEANLIKVKSHANENEQYSRRCNVRIYGIPEEQGENCYDAVLKFCENDLKCAVALDEIDRTHRVGNSRGACFETTCYNCKFLSFQTKLRVLKHRRNLKGSKKFINVDLTFVNKALFDVARKDLRGLSVWTSDGKVLVKLSNEKIVRIKSKEDIYQKKHACALLSLYTTFGKSFIYYIFLSTFSVCYLVQSEVSVIYWEFWEFNGG